MHYTKKFLERFDRLLVLLMIIAIAMYFWGTTLNGVVILINGGSMPVNAEPDMFIGNSNVAHHFTKEGGAKLLFLADVITIRFPEITIPEGMMWDKLYEVARLVDYPLDGGLNYVSIGDLLRWMSVPVFLVTILPFLVRIVFRFAREGISYVRKKP